MKIDLLSPETFAAGQPHDQFAWLRENAPVRWHDEPNGRGFWAVTRHADVWAVDRDFQAYSSEPTIMISDPAAGQAQGFGPYKMMLMMDPPDHTAFRKLIRGEFTLPAARLREDRIKALARQIVDRVIDKGACDFVDEVAGEMPSFVIAELMGLPLSDGRELYKLTETIHTAPEALPPGAGGQAVMKMFEYATGVIAEKRARPGDDLASKLLACEVDGRRLEDMEFLLFFLLLVDAGGDTTRNLLSGGLLALMENPDQLAWLLADLPGRLPTAREELLRWASPVIYMRRTAKRDVELAGQKIAEGDKVTMWYASANRDETKFDNPWMFDVTRDSNHVGFGGGGVHFCLGANLARREISLVFEELRNRIPDIAVTEEPAMLLSSFIHGIKRLPVSWTV